MIEQMIAVIQNARLLSKWVLPAHVNNANPPFGLFATMMKPAAPACCGAVSTISFMLENNAPL
jgi:hypothetical protein